MPELHQSTQEKHCPKCQSTIPDKAVVCPICRSDIGRKAETTRDRFINAAKFVKDWIGFPAAVIAAAALIVPIQGNILKLLRQDGAVLKLEFLRPDFINIGLDDTPASSQVDEVFKHIPFLRFTLTNKGLSSVTARQDFACSIIGENSEITTGHFYLIDINTHKRILDDVKLDAGGSTFINVALRDMGPQVDGYGATNGPNTCDIDYSDKYGSNTLVVDDGDVLSSLMSLERADDSRIESRAKYCPDMVKGITLGGEPIDCVDQDHLLAIEPVYFWDRALERALRQSSEFQKTAPAAAIRTPGLVLVDCAQRNCAEKKSEMMHALNHFTPSVAVWVCAPSKTDLKNEKECAKTEFPLTSP
ncbi:hypothetical protein NKI61_10040 [Mesorhizobium sp. M0514]|uniref:hypothetical protein n=1 Tax=Mesorhizobium sp. M0514 TaxID=2956955 RepID=UPI003338CAE3